MDAQGWLGISLNDPGTTGEDQQAAMVWLGKRRRASGRRPASALEQAPHRSQSPDTGKETMKKIRAMARFCWGSRPPCWVKAAMAPGGDSPPGPGTDPLEQGPLKSRGAGLECSLSPARQSGR